MKNVKSLLYKNWHDLKSDYIDDIYGKRGFSRGEFAFRGQASEAWSLTPSYDRQFSDPSKAVKLIDYYKHYSAFDDHDMDGSQRDIFLVAHAQHSGVPTRLLDWSESPYVGMFFAFSEYISNLANSSDATVAIWALNLSSNLWQEENGVKLVRLSSTKGNLRIRNQEGLFTLLSTPQHSLESYVAQFEEQEIPPLIKAIVPANNAAVALSELDAMKINPSTMFPDTEGYARASVQRFKLESCCSKI